MINKRKAVEEFFSCCVHAKIRDAKNPFEFAELKHEGWKNNCPNLVALMEELWRTEEDTVWLLQKHEWSRKYQRWQYPIGEEYALTNEQVKKLNLGDE